MTFSEILKEILIPYAAPVVVSGIAG